jgi:hypothetical protein
LDTNTVFLFRRDASGLFEDAPYCSPEHGVKIYSVRERSLARHTTFPRIARRVLDRLSVR